jgi:predicted GNAT family acetyltransferase
MDVRVLGSDDAATLESFLRLHRDSSMFLRSNVRKAGLEFKGERYQATYVAGYREGRLMGVVAHSWSGMLTLQAPEAIEEIVSRCVEASGRKVVGLSGPLEQVRRARRALRLEGVATAMEADEALYVLELSALVLPPALSEGQVACRPPLPEERNTLCAWRHAYSVETLGGSDTAAAREAAASSIDMQMAEGNVWVVVTHGEPVSLAGFNATLPDIVQLGGIYTPPALRGRGYAKAAVAGALQVAIERGATRAVLFTDNPSAMRSYQAVGFRRAGDYGLVLLK